MVSISRHFNHIINWNDLLMDFKKLRYFFKLMVSLRQLDFSCYLLMIISKMIKEQ